MREIFPVRVDRPYTIYNCAMSLDGRTATTGNDSKFSGEQDWMRVHELRDSVDGICVGIGTVLADNPKLRVKYIEHPRHPHRIVVDSTLKIPVDAELIRFERAGVRVLIGTTVNATLDVSKMGALRSKHVEIYTCGNGPRVDLVGFWHVLKSQHIDSVLVEGGGTLAGSLLAAHLVDELRVFIASRIVAGPVPGATAMVMGLDFPVVERSIALELVNVERMGGGMYARYILK